jgi:release factor glutamine methyltransferase
MPVDAEVWTVRRLLAWTRDFFRGKDVEEPRMSAEVLLAHALGCERLQLFLRQDHAPDPPQRDAFRELVKRRAGNEPLGYLTGKAPFFGFEFVVGPAVLIPRPETEMLVERAAAEARPHRERPLDGGGNGEAAAAGPVTVIDLCTGSGCVACAIARLLPNARVIAGDISAEALSVAAANAAGLGVSDRVSFHRGDLFAALPAGTPPADILVANPPYVPDAVVAGLDPTVRDFEPRAALAGGADGLDFVRRIVAGAPAVLKPGGLLLVEIGHDQGDAARNIALSVPGFSDISVLRDFQGQSRVLCVRYTK